MVTINLRGPEGNAFSLIGQAREYARQLDLDKNIITERMMSGDYENLLKVFEEYFGDYVTLER